MQGVQEARISPDGGHIAYVLSVPRKLFEDDDGPAYTEVHVVDQQGRWRPFVTGKVSIGSLAWKPDGSGSSFLDKRQDDKNKCVYFLPLENDTRVHPSQSMELYRYLKTLGQAPVRLVLYPGEGHGNREAAARYDYSLRLMQWMQHYLDGSRNRRPLPPEVDYSPAKPKDPESPPRGGQAEEVSG